MIRENTVIIASYDSKQIDKTYMLDVTSKSFYYHSREHFSIDRIIGYLSIFMITMTIMVTIRVPYLPDLSFYLDALSSNFKILMVAIGVVVGVLIFLVLKIKSQQLHITEYLNQYPDLEKVTEKDEIDKIMNRAQIRSVLVIATTIGLLIWSAFKYRQFWDYHNVVYYLWATALFLTASALASLWENTLFILKLHKEMYAEDS